MKLRLPIKYVAVIVVSALTLMGSSLLPTTVHADTIPPACTDGDILRYLWAGANFTFDVHEACAGASNSNPDASTGQQSPRIPLT